MLGRTSGQEDCLYLNVFTKWKGMNSDHPEDASLTIDLLPVMIYIHGGGFMAGSSSEMTMGPDLLLQEDIVSEEISMRDDYDSLILSLS